MFSVYSVLKNTISEGKYKLEEVLNRIKRFYISGDLDESQMDELLQMASTGATADAERPELVKLIETLAEKITALEARLARLEGGNNGGEDNTEQTEYPEWKPWDGISKEYQYGSIVSYNGKLWVSVFNGQNVWAPGTGNGLWLKYDPATGIGELP